MSETIKLFQYNTLSALFAGLYGGTLKIKDLLQYGDHGIGTLNAIDGELIVIDGKAYQTKSENGQVQVIEVDPNEKVPMLRSFLIKLRLCSINTTQSTIKI